jgi:beta-lactamase superfamily II metal-dependent hydrolase
MARRTKPRATDALQARLNPPPGGAVVRMYRIGHGDCFLIAFAGKEAGKPAYVLIDCGYKPGSPSKLATPTAVKDIGADIIRTTGGFVDVAVVTHEHQDHLNGLTPSNFPGLKVGEVWFAWTEDPDDEIANKLRKKFRDRLLGLIDAGNQLRGLGINAVADRVAVFLEMELGEDAGPFHGAGMGAAGKDPASSANKQAMKFLRDCSKGDSKYLLPHGKPVAIGGAANARAFVLGPPRDIDKIDDLDPQGDETFGDDDHPQALAAGLGGRSATTGSSFPRAHVIPLESVYGHPQFGDFFRARFGDQSVPVLDAPDGEDIPDNAGWRRIGADSAQDAEALALAMNNATNNSSLVLAFELSKGGKVLLFAGDAQAGNWRSWSESSFHDGREEVSAKDLLGRTVLYKVGHHGSHNATLNGSLKSDHANLAWMAQGDQSDEFVAMITAVEKWAHQKPKPDWNHPFPPIKVALEEKCRGRVLQTDSDLQDDPPPVAKAREWREFRSRVKQTLLYFDFTIEG